MYVYSISTYVTALGVCLCTLVQFLNIIKLLSIIFPILAILTKSEQNKCSYSGMSWFEISEFELIAEQVKMCLGVSSS